MPPRELRIRRLASPDARLDQVHRLMEQTFSPDVVEEKDWYARLLDDTRSGTCSNPFVMIVLLDARDRVTGYASGNYMPFPDPVAGCGFAALGHIFITPDQRGTGSGRELLRRFESECRAHAAALRQTMFATVGEVEDEATGFFRREGFGWPGNVYYAQPPLRFDPTTGESRYREVPENLMLRLAGSRRRLAKPRLVQVVRSLYDYWIVEKHRLRWPARSRRALARVQAIVDEVFDEVRRSIEAVPGGFVTLQPPPPTCLQAQDQARGISLRELAEADSEEVDRRLIPEVFDPLSVGKARETCRRFLRARDEPLAEETVYVVVGAGGELLGLTGLYIVGFSTGAAGLSRGRPVAGRLGWFGLRRSARGAGRGAAALRLTEALAERRGLGMLCIETSNNPMYAAAGRLYAHLGYRCDVNVRDYFDKGRHVAHYWLDVSAGGSRKGARGVRARPLTRGSYSRLRGTLDPLFGRDAGVFADCVERHFAEREAPAAKRRLWLIESEFHVLSKGTRPAGAVGFARYRWIADDVFWVRWIGADRARLGAADALASVVELCTRRGARMVVLELSGPSFAAAAREHGFRSTSEIPDLYLPHPQWLRLLRRERRLQLVTGDELAEAQRRRLTFQIYAKPCSRRSDRP